MQGLPVDLCVCLQNIPNIFFSHLNPNLDNLVPNPMIRNLIVREDCVKAWSSLRMFTLHHSTNSARRQHTPQTVHTRHSFHFTNCEHLAQCAVHTLTQCTVHSQHSALCTRNAYTSIHTPMFSLFGFFLGVFILGHSMFANWTLNLFHWKRTQQHKTHDHHPHDICTYCQFF